jgi:segregation and condensation protein B
VEAMIFAAPEPVDRNLLARLVGDNCNIDLLVDDIRRELSRRPYDIIEVAGGFQPRTRPRYGDMLRSLLTESDQVRKLSERENLVLLVIAYFQPVTRGEISAILGREISYDLLSSLRSRNLVGAGPRSPQPGAPNTLITTSHFLSVWGLSGLHELPDLEELRAEGLLSKETLTEHLRIISYDAERGDADGDGPVSDDNAEEILGQLSQNFG